MKTPLLFLCLALLALPAWADDANVLVLKHSKQEAEADPALAGLKANAEKTAAEEKSLKDQQEDLTQQNIGITQKYTKDNSPAITKGLDEHNNYVQGYQKKFDILNGELRDVQKRMPDAKKNTVAAREAYEIAAWERRIDDKKYQVFATAGSEWVENKEHHGHLDNSVVLIDGAGKKYYLAAPQSIEHYTMLRCSLWLQHAEIIALRDAQMVDEKDATPSLKVGLDQIYFPERGKLRAECPFGRVVDATAAPAHD